MNNLIYNELPTVFTWYDNLKKQRRFVENAANNCDYKLISPTNALLPFQLIVPVGFAQPTKWEIMSGCNDVAIDISNNISLLKARETEGGIYVYYKGDVLRFAGATETIELKMPEATYYSRLTFADGTQFFSETFTAFKDLSRFTKIEYWNGCDIQPIMYNGIDWKQLLYLDTFIHVGEPQVEEEGERDGDDKLIPTFQSITVTYKFAALVPDFIKIAISSMQIHDEVYLTTPGEIRTGKIERMTTSATVESGGAYSTIEVSLEQLIVVRDSCCENIVIANQNPWI